MGSDKSAILIDTRKKNPSKVSKHFRFDWQYALEMSKLPLLRPASLIIGFMPLLTQVSTSSFGITIASVPLSAWLMWWSAMFFLASWCVLKVWCPQLVQQYQNYGQYEAYRHSHRWVVWLFYNTITSLSSSWERIVKETHAKGLSVKVGEVRDLAEYRVCPVRVRRDQDADYEPFNPPKTAEEIVVFAPEQVGRDIYVPIHCDGERILLLLQEDDPNLPKKEKELFWILLTQAVKEAPKARTAFWILLVIPLILLGVNILKNIGSVVWWFSLGD